MCSQKGYRLKNHNNLACKDYEGVKICVCESDYGIGAFPLSLMIATYLSERINTVYEDFSKEGYISQMLNEKGVVRQKDGGYLFGGYSIGEPHIPKGNSATRVINYGKGIADIKEGLWEWDIVICLCSLKCWNAKLAKELITYLNICEDLRIVVDCETSKEKLYEVFGRNMRVYVLPDIKEYDAGEKLDVKVKEFVERLLLE